MIPRRLRELADIAPDDEDDEEAEAEFVEYLLAALKLPEVQQAVAAAVWKNKPANPTPTTRGSRRGR